MSDLQRFAQQIEMRLAAHRKAPHWESDQARRYMQELAPRTQQFERLASHLTDLVIRPRVEVVAKEFPHAALCDNEPPGRCVCWFGYCQRFPAAVKVEFAVEHDVRFEKAIVRYELYMMPVFIKFEPYDRLTLALDEVDDEKVAAWVEKRLLEFLDAYLQNDRGEEDFEEDVATDPVCGMRIRRSEAAAKSDYRGTVYFFCSDGCRQKFAGAPAEYVVCKTL